MIVPSDFVSKGFTVAKIITCTHTFIYTYIENKKNRDKSDYYKKNGL